jgi:hypothetical protein
VLGSLGGVFPVKPTFAVLDLTENKAFQKNPQKLEHFS